MPKRPDYRQECACGACPKQRSDRPGTLQEWITYWGHDGWFSPAKVYRLAVNSYLFQYAQWVNTRGWRKPPGWTGGRVPLDKVLPKNRRIFVDEYRRAAQRLMKEAPDVG